MQLEKKIETKSMSTSINKMATSLNIISKSKVQPAISDYPPSSSTIQLSFFDAKFIQFPIMNTILLYPNAIPSPSSFNSFKSSLALTLRHFHPFAGELAYSPSAGDVAIICSKDSGVDVIEAKSNLDICGIMEKSSLDVDSLLTLVPNLDAVELPIPVLSIQFTLFSGGGIGVGVASHHAAIDGWGFWQFINCWAEMCRNGTVPSELAPVHDRSIISFSNKEELRKQVLKLYAPNLPKINPNVNRPIQGHTDRSIERLFTVDPSSIQILKQRAIQETITPLSTPPSSFQVLASLFWIVFARAKGLTSEDTTPMVLIITMDCRALLDPPIAASYTGNCACSIFVESNGTNLMAQDGLSKTCAIIAKAISIAKKQPLESSIMNALEHTTRSFNGLTVVLSGSPKLRALDADFGWGKPAFHAVVPINLDGVGLMTAGREEGAVRLQVTLKGGMEEFGRTFEGGFGR